MSKTLEGNNGVHGGGEAGHLSWATGSCGKHNSHIALSKSQCPSSRATRWLACVVGIVALVNPSNPSMVAAHPCDPVPGQGKCGMVEGAGCFSKGMLLNL